MMPQEFTLYRHYLRMVKNAIIQTQHFRDPARMLGCVYIVEAIDILGVFL